MPRGPALNAKVVEVAPALKDDRSGTRQAVDLGGIHAAAETLQKKSRPLLQESSRPQTRQELELRDTLSAAGVLEEEWAVGRAEASVVAFVTQQLWEKGLKLLTASECTMAERLFARAISVLDVTPKPAPTTRDEESMAVMQMVRSEITFDHGMSLVCSKNFSEGIAVLSQRLESLEPGRQPPHLLNAIGYAHFNQEEYLLAGRAFRLAVGAKPHNPLLWSNLAAAEMLVGNLEAADYAFLQAAEYVEAEDHAQSESFIMELLSRNVQLLHVLVTGEGLADHPVVELFYNENWRWGD